MGIYFEYTYRLAVYPSPGVGVRSNTTECTGVVYDTKLASGSSYNLVTDKLLYIAQLTGKLKFGAFHEQIYIPPVRAQQENLKLTMELGAGTSWARAALMRWAFVHHHNQH